jgi:hypothetical protein
VRRPKVTLHPSGIGSLWDGNQHTRTLHDQQTVETHARRDSQSLEVKFFLEDLVHRRITLARCGPIDTVVRAFIRAASCDNSVLTT